jgi:hypothetical protein
VYETWICQVFLTDEEKSRLYGVMAGNELEAQEHIERSFERTDVENFSIGEIRRATVREISSLKLSAGRVKLLT